MLTKECNSFYQHAQPCFPHVTQTTDLTRRHRQYSFIWWYWSGGWWSCWSGGNNILRVRTCCLKILQGLYGMCVLQDFQLSSSYRSNMKGTGKKDGWFLVKRIFKFNSPAYSQVFNVLITAITCRLFGLLDWNFPSV